MLDVLISGKFALYHGLIWNCQIQGETQNWRRKLFNTQLKFCLPLEKRQKNFKKEARLLLALKYYETGKLSTGLAAQLAGVPRTTFIFLLGRHGLSPFGETPEKLEESLENARKASHGQ